MKLPHFAQPELRAMSLIYASAARSVTTGYFAKNGWQLELAGESSNLFNRLSREKQITDDCGRKSAKNPLSSFIIKYLRISCRRHRPMPDARWNLRYGWDSKADDCHQEVNGGQILHNT